MTVGGEGAKPAETEVVVREVLADALLVEARPLTGRKHQVRAHLAARRDCRSSATRSTGTPGGAAPRLMLHARRLALPHPLTGEPLVIESPLPADFEAVLARLRSAGASRRRGACARRAGSSKRHGPRRVGRSSAACSAARKSRRGHSRAPRLARCGV